MHDQKSQLLRLNGENYKNHYSQAEVHPGRSGPDLDSEVKQTTAMKVRLEGWTL
jgi:hypothetical protein